MITVINEFSNYFIIFFFVLYTISGFFGIGRNKKILFVYQRIFIFIIQFFAFLVLYLQSMEEKYLYMYIGQLVLIMTIMVTYRIFYSKMSMLIINNMCMLLTIGGFMIARLSFMKSIKQCLILAGTLIISLIVPVIIRKCKFLSALTWVYAVSGILFLVLMKLAGSITYGASISFSIGGISVQPVEFVKLLYVFFMAAYLSKNNAFKDLIIVSVVTCIHILLLVWAKELGGALILFIVYIAMIYIASHKPLYALAGLGGGGVAAFIAYHLFNHVRVRVQTWSTPFSVIKNDTSQISQSLFAIGTGGWFGLGLFGGIPDKIPVADEDLIFSAITEELGLLFSLCIILVCLTTFIMFINIATRIKRPFYKLLAVGFGVEYIFQVFLTIGGGTKFIPLTGVTLPLVSYGGSSLLCTMIMFSIIQGIYIMRQDEGESEEFDEFEDEYYEYDYDIGDDYYGKE